MYHQDLEFASIMVQNLNNNLITAPELADLRKRLRNLDSRVIHPDTLSYVLRLMKYLGWSNVLCWAFQVVVPQRCLYILSLPPCPGL